MGRRPDPFCTSYSPQRSQHSIMLSHRSPIWRHIVQHVVPSLLVNGVAPFVVYTLVHPHMSQLHALMIAALVPLADGIVGLVRQRRINAFGALVFLSLVLSSLLVLVGGSPRLILVRESALSGVFGVLMLLSLFWPQPLVYYLARHFVAPRVSGMAHVPAHGGLAPLPLLPAPADRHLGPGDRAGCRAQHLSGLSPTGRHLPGGHATRTLQHDGGHLHLDVGPRPPWAVPYRPVHCLSRG